MGSSWYLGDESSQYPNQNIVDPFAGRIPMYMNAKNCTLTWIEESARRASIGNKRALFFMMQASFYVDFGERAFGGAPFVGSERPFDSLFAKLTATALSYPRIMFYVVHADVHRFATVRMNPTKSNSGILGSNAYYSHHNLMIHSVEGHSRALTMYTKFTVDNVSFQPVTLKEEWSQAAYNQVPLGHTATVY